MLDQYIKQLQQKIIANSIDNPQLLKQLAFLLEEKQGNPGHKIWIIKESWTQDSESGGSFESENIHVFDNYILLKKAIASLLKEEESWKLNISYSEASQLLEQIKHCLDSDILHSIPNVINNLESEYNFYIYESKINEMVQDL